MTIQKLSASLASLALGGLLTAALPAHAADKAPDISKLPPPATKTGITFDEHIKKIIEPSCLKCHSGNRPKGRYAVTTREAFVKGGDSGKPAIIPGKSAESPVIHFAADLVLDMEMPPVDMRQDFPALTKDQIATLRAWIDQGAK
ncbi:MAG: hypothetical protein KJ072_20355 [Verrucomicrobia bacterium]|nr:hypothetical protein [Verrucomicrobiota bacterium]